MAKGINKVILVGNLGNDPDFTQTASGLQVAKCSIATSRIWNDSHGQRQEKTEWHRVVFFNRLAEIVSQYLKKGMQVYVEGELRTNSWEKDGITRYSTEIIAREMQMLGSKQSPGSPPVDHYEQEFSGSSHSTTGEDSAKGQPKPAQEEDIEQDIPF